MSAPHAPARFALARCRRAPACWLALLLVALLGLAGRATAAPGTCQEPINAWQPVFFPSPGTVVLPPANATYPVKLWSVSAASAAPPQLVCTPNAANSVFDYLAPIYSVPNGTTLMPTNIPNLAMTITYAGVDLQAYNGVVPPPTITAYPIPTNGNAPVTLGAPSTLTLYATGPIAAGVSLSGQIAQWQAYTGTGAVPIINSYQIGGTITFAPSACSIITDPTIVTLPPQGTQPFTGAGTTLAKTPFSIKLNCSGGASPMVVTLAPGTPAFGSLANGILTSTTGSGYATNVGVQLLDGSGKPVNLGCSPARTSPPPGTPAPGVPSTCAIPVGNTGAGGEFDLPFFAQYYQTGAPVTPGKVSATAIYTVTYR